jgi:hypothetical protein
MRSPEALESAERESGSAAARDPYGLSTTTARGHIQRCSSTSSTPVDAAPSRWSANSIEYYGLSQPNPYRGQAVRATDNQGLTLSIFDLPVTATRDMIIAPDSVWAEMDLGLTAVRDRHAMLNTHGLGARRGVLLCGPPGTGKSAISAVLARELVGQFTVIYVEAKAGAQLLTAVVDEAQRLGGPVLLVLEDVDLWCRDRKTDGRGLSELLQAMDIRPEARILTLASTNDAATLDKAAVRTGRFDSIIEVGYPTTADAARILAALIRGIPGSQNVDSTTVIAALPEKSAVATSAKSSGAQYWQTRGTSAPQHYFQRSAPDATAPNRQQGCTYS